MKYFLFGFIFFLIYCKSVPTLDPRVTETIKAIEKKYAPDKRTAIFSIEPVMQNQQLILKGELSENRIKQEILDSLEAFAYIDSIEVLPSKSLEDFRFGVITIPVANVRSKPGHSSELVNQLLCGTVVRLYKYANGWLYTQSPEDYLGWIDEDALQLMDSARYRSWHATQKIIVIADQTYLYAQPAWTAEITAGLSTGAILRFIQPGDEFFEAAFADGRTGFIPNEHATGLEEWKQQHQNSPSSESILRAAFAYLGRPYLWGGTSGNGMDCSGFTKMVLFQHGWLLPRDASQQALVGMEIETDTTLKNIIPGDFLFFGRQATQQQPAKVTHVAIYAGEGKIIHASGYIRIQSLRREDSTFTEYRLRSLLKATRPLTAPKEHGILSLSDLSYYD